MKAASVQINRYLVAAALLLLPFCLNASGEEIVMPANTQTDQPTLENSDTSRLGVYNNITVVLNNVASNAKAAVAQQGNTKPVLDIYQQIISVLGNISKNIESNSVVVATVSHQATKTVSIPKTLNPYSRKNSALARGKALFYEMQCISCHGINGKGHEAKTNMKDERGLHIMAADLTQPSSFGNGNTRNDIFRTVMTGLDGTPMPSFVDLFVGQEDRAWDLVEYVYSLQEDTLARFLP